MAFTVEDGTGLDNANAYISVEEADEYHSDRGNAGWVGANPVKQAAIIKATSYVESMYTWLSGSRITAVQRLNWPRYSAWDSEGWGFDADEIPAKLKDAVAELALVALTQDLLPSFDRVTKREKIGQLEIEYADTNTMPRFPIVDGLLYGIASFAAPTRPGGISFTEVERS